MPDTSLQISVVVPTYNRREIVVRSLMALLSQSFPADKYEVIVVVDGSSDGTAEALRGMLPACRLRIIEQENRGPSAARNAGFRAAASDLVLFLDDDMRCDPDLVAAHVNAHEKLGVAVVFGAIFLDSVSRRILATECFERELGSFHLRHSHDRTSTWQITDCVFSNSSLPRQILVQVGGFDEDFRMREDLELGLRLRETGIRMEYASDAIAYQYYDKNQADLCRDAELFGIADVKLEAKHPKFSLERHDGNLYKNWKTNLLTFASQSRILETCLVAPWCTIGELLFPLPLIRLVGVRALQIRRRIHWLRGRQGSGVPRLRSGDKQPETL